METPSWGIGPTPPGLESDSRRSRADVGGRRHAMHQMAASILLASGLAPARSAPAPGEVLLLRHARTEPGVGDPPGFRLGECRTQRQLSEDGRAQARRLGERLRREGWIPQRVRSSRWCRCGDTAREAFGQVEDWPALDSFFENRASEPAQTAELRRTLATLPAQRREVWVTHMVNIAALTGETVAMGEGLLLEGGSGRVLRRLAAE